MIISAVLTAFAYPAARSSLHDIPIAVAGPSAATGQVVAALEQRDAEAFDVTLVADTAAAETAISEREVYGAIDVSTGTPSVLIASAASPVIAQTLQASGASLNEEGQAAARAPVRDLAPLPADDPRGAGLSAGSLPLVLGGMLAALLLTNRVRGAAQRLTGALAYSVTGALVMAAILQFWLGSLEGNYLANAGVIALSVAATSFVIIGLEALLGTPGFGLGALVMMLLGNPLSGMTSAPEMLPGRSGQIGQFLPPGAAGCCARPRSSTATAQPARSSSSRSGSWPVRCWWSSVAPGPVGRLPVLRTRNQRRHPSLRDSDRSCCCTWWRI